MPYKSTTEKWLQNYSPSSMGLLFFLCCSASHKLNNQLYKILRLLPVKIPVIVTASFFTKL